MALAEIAVTQSDCPHVETSGKFPNIYILIMNTQLIEGRQKMFSIFYSADRDELDGALSYFSRHKRVGEFVLLSKKNGIATAVYVTKATSLFMKLGPTGFRIHPVVVHKGIEKWFFISNSPEGPTAGQISDRFTKVVSLKNITQEQFFSVYPSVFYELHALKILGNLSERDVALFKAAAEGGFFNWPRRMSLTGLSKQLSMSKSTLSYHLRMIEKRMANVLAEQL